MRLTCPRPRVVVGGAADLRVPVDHDGERRVQPLREFVAALPAGSVSASFGDGDGAPLPYLRTWNAFEDAPSLLDDVYLPPPHFDDLFTRLPAAKRPPFQWLFLGPAGATTPLHVDIWHTDVRAPPALRLHVTRRMTCARRRRNARARRRG